MKLDLRKIHVAYINLEEHKEKNQRMIDMLSGLGFESIQRIEGVRHKKGSIGCSLAHAKALEELSKRDTFILLEDDCRVLRFRHDIEIPDNADALYLGISGWGRMNGHSGAYVQHEKTEFVNILRIKNMLSAHAVLYFKNSYLDMCKRIAKEAGLSGNFQDIGFAEIQRWFNVYSLDTPAFYQDSSRDITINPLSSYHTYKCLEYEKDQFFPVTI